jgi:hypothetical protein
MRGRQRSNLVPECDQRLSPMMREEDASIATTHGGISAKNRPS